VKSIITEHADGRWLAGALDNQESYSFAVCIGFAVVTLALGLLFMSHEWHVFLVGFVYVSISLYLVVKFNKAVYLLILLVPFHPDYAGILLKTSWNFKVGESAIDRIPISVLIILAAFAGYQLNRWSKLRQFQDNTLRKAFFILLGYAAILTFYAPNFWHSLFQYLILVVNVMLFTVVFHSIEDELTYKKIMWYWIFVAIAMGFFSCSLFLMSNNVWDVSYPISEYLVFKESIAAGPIATSGLIGRAHVFSTPHELGFFMNMSLAIAMGLLLSEKDKARKWFLIGTIYFFVCINLLTLGRGAFVGLVTTLTFFLLAVKVIRMRFFIFAAIFAIGVVGTLQVENVVMNSIFLRTPVTTRIVKVTETFANKAGIESQAPERMKIWKKGFRDLKKSNFVGLGAGNFKYYQRAPHAHSVLLSFLFDFGLVGLGVVVFIAGTMLVGMFKFLNRQETYMQLMNVSVLGGVMGTGIHALVDFEYNSPLVWLFIAVAFVTINLTRQEAASDKSKEAAASLFDETVVEMILRQRHCSTR